MTEQKELQEVEAVVEATNAVSIAEPLKAALVADLRPIAERMAGYVAATLEPVNNRADVDRAAQVIGMITADIKAVEGQEVLSKVTDGLHKLHRQWTAARALFLTPLEAHKKAIKLKVIRWQEEESEKAAALQRKLQAEADEKARREREKLEAQALKYKTEEKREEKLAAAAAVIAPTIHIEAPKTGIRSSKHWVAELRDQGAFLAACVARPELAGYIEIKLTSLVRAKEANNMFTAPGVEFRQETR